MVKVSLIKLSNAQIKFLGAMLVFVVSALVFSQYGFNGKLLRDDAVYMYSGQQMAKGIPPYVSIFDPKGPVAPIISGIGVLFAHLVHIDDVFAVRISFFIVSLFTVVGLYLLSLELFSSQKIAFLSSFIFINFWGFGKHAASGPRAKTPMVLFEVLTFWMAARRAWFWAGVCSSLAFLTWQPTIIFPVITILVAVIQSKGNSERIKNVFKALAGVITPLIVISVYFLYKNAFQDFLDGFILYHIGSVESEAMSIIDNLRNIIVSMVYGYTTMFIPILFGLLAILLVIKNRVALYKNNVFKWLSNDFFVVLAVSFPLPFAWSLLDFQSYPDFYVFLPYAAIGFSWLTIQITNIFIFRYKLSLTIRNNLCLAICIILIVGAFVSYRITASEKLEIQRGWANEIINKYGENVKLVSVGVPEALVLAHKTNPNPYAQMNNTIEEARIEVKTQGGFDGWLENLERYDPSIILLGSTSDKYRLKLTNWLENNYQETEVGEWRAFVKEDKHD